MSTPTLTTPAAERFASPEFEEYGHTPATWAVYWTCPAAVEADAIYRSAEALEALLAAWDRSHGRTRDPGVAAILAAGHAVPPAVTEDGTTLRYVAPQVRGFLWAVRSFLDLVRDEIPDVTADREGGVE